MCKWGGRHQKWWMAKKQQKEKIRDFMTKELLGIGNYRVKIYLTY